MLTSQQAGGPTWFHGPRLVSHGCAAPVLSSITSLHTKAGQHAKGRSVGSSIHVQPKRSGNLVAQPHSRWQLAAPAGATTASTRTRCAAWLAWTRHAAPRVPAAALLQAAWPRRRCVARNRSAAAAGLPARAPRQQLLSSADAERSSGHGKKAVIAHNQRSIMHFGWAALSQHASASSRKGAEPERLTPAAARASQEKGQVAGLGGGGGGADRDGSCKDSGLSCAHEGCCMPEELQFVDTSCDAITHLSWAAA